MVMPFFVLHLYKLVMDIFSCVPPWCLYMYIYIYKNDRLKLTP